ncbi:MAG TPA: YggT family protein [Chloroflexi bacterium]|nr:YggT family protein [Chloroflexota bacterium]
MIASIINLIYYIFIILLLARVVFSWIRPDPYHPTWGPLMRLVFQITEPILAPVRRILPPMGGLDLSPLIVWVAASFARTALISIF